MKGPILVIVFFCSCLGCSEEPEQETPVAKAPKASNTEAGSVALTSPAVPPDVVATVMGKPIRRSDCVSPGQGIRTPEIGIYSLVLRMLMGDFSQSQSLTVSLVEMEAFCSALRANAKRINPNLPQPSVPDPAFDQASVQAKLQEVQGKLAVVDLPLLEKMELQSQVEGLQQALELKSQAAIIAYGQLMPLRIEAALYKKYGGKVVARQISIHASGAYLTLAEDAQASGKLVFHDETLKQVFWKRLNDDLQNTEVPPERVDFSLPLLMQGAAHIPPRTVPNATPTSTSPEAPTTDKKEQP